MEPPAAGYRGCPRGGGPAAWERPGAAGPRADHGACAVDLAGDGAPQATATGILPIFACHSFGPVSCTLVPLESTATVTGMSFTSNS